MKYDSVLHLSLQQIQIFLKCYQYRSFSRVAYEYNYTPSMISKNIHTVENLLGYELFIRKYHSLIPTAAADILAEEWADIFDVVERGIEKAAKIHMLDAAQIRIGVLGNSRICGEYVWDRLKSGMNPELLNEIKWERKDMRELPAMLNEDYFDFIVTSSRYMPVVDNGLNTWKSILSAPDAVYIPRNHPLFDQELTSFADFKDYPFILLDPREYPQNYKFLLDMAQKYGFIPKIATSCMNTESAKDNLNLGKGLYLANSVMTGDWANENVRKFILYNEPYADLLLVWKKSNTKSEIKSVAEAFDK